MKALNRSSVMLRVLLFLMVFLSYEILASEANNVTEGMLDFSVIPVASGSFVQRKYFKVLKQPIKSHGELHFDVNLGLLWQTNTPLYSALILKNNSVYSEDGHNPPKKLKGASNLSLMLLSILSGNRVQIDANFIVTNSEIQGCVMLTPKQVQLSKVMQAIELCQKQSNEDTELALNHIERIILREHSGNRTEIDVKLTAISALPETVRVRFN